MVIAVYPAISAKDTKIYVIPGGDSIGLQLETGVYVSGKYGVKTEKGEVLPWKKGNLEVGDKILAINNNEVNSIEDIHGILSTLKENQDLDVKVQRKGQIINTICQAIKANNGKMTLGLYVKDEVLGVGTITYINPKDNSFAALGHSMINEKLSGSKIGIITASQIKGIRKSFPGVPGEKQAVLSKVAIGSINKNTDIGVFGTVNNLKNFTTPTMAIASPNEVHLGKAQMLTVLENNHKESFEVEIVEVKKQNSKEIKGIKIKITDKRLLEKTGGIVQGMSGSPVIQDDKLVGAVSHVIIDSPDFGYCVYAMWMVDEYPSL